MKTRILYVADLLSTINVGQIQLQRIKELHIHVYSLLLLPSSNSVWQNNWRIQEILCDKVCRITIYKC